MGFVPLGLPRAKFRVESCATWLILALIVTLQLAAPGLAQEPRVPADAPEAVPANVPPTWWAGASRGIADFEYQFKAEGDGWTAPNRSQGFRLDLGPTGLELTPRQGAATWNLQLRCEGYIRGEDRHSVEPVNPVANGRRVEWNYGDFSEWYENRALGVKHGFTLTEALGRGDRSQPLSLELVVSGSARVEISEDGQNAVFYDGNGKALANYTELVVFDAHEAQVPARMSGEGSRLLLVIDDSDATYPLLVDPILSTPSWTAEGNQAGAEFGYSVAAAGDINNDGFGDLLVGARRFDNGEADEGMAFLYLGSPTGPSLVADWTAEGNQPNARFGQRVAGLGDVNGDGFKDVAVSAHFYDNPEPDEGAVFIFLGSAAGLPAAPNMVLSSGQVQARFGSAMSAAGDVNSDGFDDLVVGALLFDNGEGNEGRAYVFAGSPTGINPTPLWIYEPNQSEARLGDSVDYAGDVNGDGFDDVIVGAPNFDNAVIDAGAAFVFFGSPTGPSLVPDWSFEGTGAVDKLGLMVAGAGDVNGDGFADVITGASGFDNENGNEGVAYIFFGSNAGPSLTPDWIAEGNQQNAEFGVTVGTAGDANGDGFADVLVGSFKYDFDITNEGGVFLYLGGPEGPSTIPALVFEGDQVEPELGGSLTSAGDLNGDGNTEFVIGAPEFDNGETGEGAAFVFFGSADLRQLVPPTWTFTENQNGAFVGEGLSCAGDVNGDGFGDYLVGSRRFDGGATNSGRAWLFLGAEGGPSTTPSWFFDGNQFNAALGISVAGAGDVNGDGFADIIIGAANFDDDQADEGRVFVFHGSPTGPSLTTPDWIVDGNQENAFFGRWVDGMADVNGDGFSDVIVGAPEFDNGEQNEGQAFLYLGSASGLELTPAWTFEGSQVGAALGRPVSSAGDVNGDGFTDILVSARRFDNPETNEGVVYAFHGSPTGPSLMPVWSIEGDQNNANFGSAISAAGDVNGDGFSDVLVGAANFNNGTSGEGITVLYLGSPTGLALTPDWLFDSNQVDANSGFSVAGVGDLNADGFGDIAVGAHLFDDTDIDEGRVFIFFGSSTGPSLVPDFTLDGEQPGAQFGYAVAPAGDVDADGDSDMLITAFAFDGTNPDQGQVYLVNGRGDIGVPRPVQQALPDDSALIAVLGRSTEEDSFRLRSAARTAAGFGKIQIEYEVKPFGTPFDGLGTVRGTFQSNALSSASELVTGLTPGDYIWRLRIHDDHPGFPSSPWLSLSQNGITEKDLLTLPPTPPVTDLTCTEVAGEIVLSWTNSAMYDAIDVFREGVLLATLAGTEVTLTDMAPFSGVTSYTVVARLGISASLPAACQGIVAPAAVDNLVCNPVGGDAQLNWNNPELYDSIRIERDGSLIDTLPGSETSYVDLAPAGGVRNYAVIGVIDGISSSPAMCTVPVPPVAISALSCADDMSNASLSWINNAIYDAIEVSRDGVLIDTLAGTDTTYQDLLPPAGIRTYSLVAFIDGVPSAAVECMVNFPPPPLANFVCMVVAGDVQITWVNTDTYDELRVLRDGVNLVTLPATATSFVDPAAPAGPHTYAVVPVIDGLLSTPVACMVDIPPAPVAALACTGSPTAVDLTWTNGELYDELTLVRDGALLAVLAGGATSFTDVAPAIGVHTYELTGFVGGVASPVASCMATVSPLPIFGVSCIDNGLGDVVLGWTNAALYDSIELRRNGTLIQTLLGTDNSFTDIRPGGGQFDYDLRGVIGGIPSAPALCTVTVIPPITYWFRAQDLSVSYNPGTGAGAMLQTLLIEEGVDNDGFPNPIRGFSMGLAHDPTLLDVDSIAPGVDLAGFNGGAGAEFFAADLVAGGFTLGCVLSFMDDSQTLNASVPRAVASVAYDTVPMTLVGNEAGVSTQLTWTDGLGGVLPVTNHVVVGTTSFEATFDHGDIQLVPVTKTFVRGDCNADGSVNLIDATSLLATLFQQGPLPTCLDACDSNDSGSLDLADPVHILVFSFAGGGAPAAPFPACGSDPTEDALDCVDFGPCP